MGRLCYPTQAPGRVLVSRLRRDQKAVTVQGGYGVVFAVRVQVFWVIRVSRYNFTGEQVTSQGTLSLIGGMSGVRICLVLQSCLKSRSKSKNHDELMNYTVRVMFRLCLLSRVAPNCQSVMPIFIQLVCSPGLRVQVKGLIFL